MRGNAPDCRERWRKSGERNYKKRILISDDPNFFAGLCVLAVVGWFWGLIEDKILDFKEGQGNHLAGPALFDSHQRFRF